jgi:AcrR family transcriptional regulator
MAEEEIMLGRQALKTKRTREKIINAVVSLLKEGGISAASSSKIAQRAGITWGAAQHHFGSKEEILAAIMEISHEEFTALMADASLRSGSRADRVDMFVDRIWQHYQGDIYLAALEIVLAARGSPDATPSLLAERQARGHVKTLREIFHDSKLDDKRLLEALIFVHCFMTGLTIERVFETKMPNLPRHLQRIKLVLLTMLSGM